MKANFLIICFSVFILDFLIAFCVKANAGDAGQQYPKALIVYQGAENVTYREFNGRQDLYYEVTIPHPAKPFIDHVNAKLSKQGWSPLEKDWLNPKLPSSHVSGWGSFVDASREVEMNVKQWLAQWKNAKGEIVVYALRYESPVGEAPNLDKLSVAALFHPKELVDLTETILKLYPKGQPSNTQIELTE